MQHEWCYISYILLSMFSFFLIEYFLRATGLLVYRFFTAVFYGFYLLTLPISTFLLATHPHRWQLFQPLTHELFVIVAITIGFYMYAIARLICFPNKRRTIPEIYHHVIFALVMSIILFVPSLSVMIFAWFYLQQIAIIPYYITYIFPIKKKKAEKMWYIIDIFIFFLSKIILVMFLLIYTVFHSDVSHSQPEVFYFAIVLFIISLIFNMYWFLIKLPKAVRCFNELKIQ